ncbi:MAG: HutD family protein, partial [Aeromonas sobria]
MITLIKESDHQKMPWKNQQGSSSQILISPTGTSLAKLDFDYRLSSAPIKS